MKKSLLPLIPISILCLLSACGGGSGSTGIHAGPATHFSFSALATATAGTAVNFSVTALDTSNNVVTDYPGTAHFTSTDPKAVLPANATLSNGTGSFSATLNTDGSQTITSTDTVTPAITGTSNSINVTNIATHLTVSAPGNATVGTAVNLAVTALDASNNVVTNYHGTLQFTSTDAQAVLPASTTLTNGAGAFSATLNTSGSQTITATDTVTPAVTGTSSAIEVSASSNGTFTPTGTMTFARAGHTATLLQNGTVLIAGGENSTGPLVSAEIFDPSTGMFTTIGSMATARVGHTATLLSDGTVLVAGGNDTTAPLATAEIFNPLNGSFTPTTGNMGAARVGHTATLLNDGTGRVLIAGGGSMMLEVLFGPVSDPGTASAELYDPKSGQFTPAANNMVASRIYHTATLLTDGEVLLAGGTNAGSALGDLFSPATATFTATAAGGTTALHLASALLRKGDVVITGGDLESAPCGIGSNWVSIQNALLFDLNGAGFSETGDMSTSRVRQTATLLRSGEVLIAGGATSRTTCNRGVGTSTFDSVASAELFNTGGTFALTGSMSTARAGQTATLLGNGQVLVAGGVNGDAKAANALSSAELYQ